MGGVCDAVSLEVVVVLFSARLFQVGPFNVLCQSIDIGIHRGGIDAEIMKTSLALGETLALDLDLE